MSGGHLWATLLATGLLVYGKLDSTSWVTLVLGVTGMRHAAEFGETYNGKDNVTDDSKSGE